MIHHKSSFLYIGDVCMAKKGMRQSIKILHRYHFTSALKRMSVIASIHSSDTSSTNHIVSTKGAPETLRKLVSYVINDKICSQNVDQL